MSRRALRKLINALALGLSGAATAVGLFFLGAILWTLIRNGLAGVSLTLFTAMTPPPGSSGGLLNAIYGSVVMTLIGILIGGPIGMLAGTYLAEYGRTTRIASVVRPYSAR
jgi:phosphate transport system permease protein